MFRSRLVLVSVISLFIGGCATLPTDIPINPAIPDLRGVPSKPGERSPISPTVNSPNLSRDSLTDHTLNRGAFEDVLREAPTQ